MRILVDADACPVKDIILEIAKENNLPVLMFFDSSHVYENDYAQVYIIEKGFDSVDYFLLGHLLPNDIVVTQDYGLASLALAKKAFAINQNGLIYSDSNIDELLSIRYLSAKARKENKHIKGPKKRSLEDDKAFEKNFLKLITLKKSSLS